MTGTILDVDAPNTAWRGGSEDPIPVIFGRYSATAFAYRFLACRPLDGHARTDATFWHAGSKAFTRSGRTMPYNYWPGWKRGLLISRVPAFGLLPWTGISALTDLMGYQDPWWLDSWAPSLAWTPWLSYGIYKGVDYGRNFQHRRNYLDPIERMAIQLLRTRDSIRAEIPRGMVGGKDGSTTGRLYVPPSLALPDGDRANLLDGVRERLGNQVIDARWNMEGRRPHMELYTPAQPPARVEWEEMLEKADPVSPHLGQSAGGAVKWDLGADSPHMGVLGGSGSGKSELIAWIVAQFMRGGAGTVVLDPKYASHRWLMNVPGVLYCAEPASLHSTIMWLDEELRRRGRLSQTSEETFSRIVVLLEERNSLQSLLREYWTEIRTPGMPQRSPALAALDRLASQGRSLGINVLLAAQEYAQVHIGSKSSYGAFCLAGRINPNGWKVIQGPGSVKPAISTQPGRFGYVVGGQATVFQAAYPNLKEHGERLKEWALGGEPLLDVSELMRNLDTPPYPSSEASSSPTEEYVTVRAFAERVDRDVKWFENQKQRYDGFPDSVGNGAHGAKLYRLTEMEEWYASK